MPVRFEIRKPGVNVVPAPEEAVALKTNKGRFQEAWVVKDPEGVYWSRKSGDRVLVIEADEHLEEPAETGKDYEIWGPSDRSRDWVFLVCYNRFASPAYELRKTSRRLPSKWGRRGGVVIVHFKPEGEKTARELLLQHLRTTSGQQRLTGLG